MDFLGVSKYQIIFKEYFLLSFIFFQPWLFHNHINCLKLQVDLLLFDQK